MSTPVTPSLLKDFLQAFNRHQRTDKGFGPALGPSASQHLTATLAAHGYRVESAAADWQLTAAHCALQGQLVLGWHEAASAMAEIEEAPLAAWLDRRQAAIAAGALAIQVGHTDVFACPP